MLSLIFVGQPVRSRNYGDEGQCAGDFHLEIMWGADVFGASITKACNRLPKEMLLC